MFGTSYLWLVALTGLAVLGILAWRYRADLGGIGEWINQRFGLNPFRMALCGVFGAGAVFVVAAVSPAQLPVTIYKMALVLLAGYLGYWLDVWLFPYSRPNGYLARNWTADKGFKPDAPDHAIVPGYEAVFCAAIIRRAVILGSCMLAVGLGL